MDPIFNCTVSDIRRLKCRKSTIFPTPLLFWLKFGGDPFGVDPWCWGQPRLESQVHKIVIRENYFGRIPTHVITIYQRYRRTDRQLIMAIPSYATLRAVKCKNHCFNYYTIPTPHHRRRIHGAITPTAKKLWGRCPQVVPTWILLRHFWNSKITLKIWIYYYASNKSCADFSLKCIKSVWRPGFARTRWGSLQRSHKPPSWI